MLCFAIMRSEIGELIFGGRIWKTVAGVAAVTFLAIAIYRPDAFTEGVNIVGQQAGEEISDVLKKAGGLPSSTTTPALTATAQ